MKTVMNKGLFSLLVVLVLTLYGCNVQRTAENAAGNEIEQTELFPDNEDGEFQDMLTPGYYNSAPDSSFRNDVNRFVHYSREETFHHPLEDEMGEIPGFSVPFNGKFGAGKGPGGMGEHHPAIDLHVGYRETNVTLYACYDGYVRTYRDAPKYRQYLTISKDVTTSDGEVVGKMVTIYAHIDLDLDEADSLFMDGQMVAKGDVVSRYLYSGTKGGPHLHFEIRYYRPDDKGDETFYGIMGAELTEPSVFPWSYGYWNTEVGFGFGEAGNHGFHLYDE